MTTSTDQFSVFAAACRQNTGKSLLDSGGHYGRWWQAAPITPDTPAVTIDVHEQRNGAPKLSSATIETAHFLDHAFTHDAELQARFEEWQRDKEGDWFELGELFATEVLGMLQHARDNVYNGENELTQVFVWEVYSPQVESDWIFAKEALTVVYVHTGCDVRGGYGAPLFCRSNDSSYAIPVNFVAEYYASEGVDADGNELDRDDLQRIDEHWQAGYSGYPTGQVRDAIEKIVEYSEPEGWLRAKLKTGETVKIHAQLPYIG